MITPNEIKPAAPAEGLDGGRCAVDAGSVAATPAAEPTEEEIHMEQLQRDERENWVQVTREMARDAGDPSYEGAWVKW